MEINHIDRTMTEEKLREYVISMSKQGIVTESRGLRIETEPWDFRIEYIPNCYMG
jgi:hypothetical protein